MRLKRHCVRILIEEKWQVLTDKYIALIKFPLFATDDVKYKIYLSTVKKNDWDTLTIFNEQSFCFINGTLLVNIHVYIEKKHLLIWQKWNEYTSFSFNLYSMVLVLSYNIQTYITWEVLAKITSQQHRNANVLVNHQTQ